MRLIALVLLVVAATAGAFVLTRADTSSDAWLVLATGLALAAVTGALVLTRKRRRLAMGEVERYFTLAPEMVVLAGLDGYWKRVNPAVESVLGYTESEALARPFIEFVHPDDRKRSEEEVRRVVGGAVALAFEARMLCKDASYKWIEWTAQPVPEQRVIYGIGRDVTERRRSESEQAALRRIATLVAREAPQAKVFASIAEEIGRLLGAENVRMLRFDNDGGAVVVGVSGRPDAFPLGSQQQLEGDSVASRVRRSGQPARMDDYAEAYGPLAEAVRSTGVRAVVGVPVLVQGELWGVIITASTTDEALPPETESRLARFTDLMATAIANAEARAEVHRLADEQAALRRVATLVARETAPVEIFGAVTEEARRVLGSEAVGLLRFERDETATLVAQSETPWDPPPVGTRFTLDGENLVVQVLRTGETSRVDDWAASTGAVGAMASVLGVRSAVASPVVVEGRLWGTIIAATSQNEPLPADMESRIVHFTDLIATAISNAESRDALARLADEQAALRRVATLVARDATSTEVFEAVATEVAKLLDTDITVLGRYDDDGAVTAIGSWSASGAGVPVGTRSAVSGRNVLTLVSDTGKPARIDGYDDASGEAAEIARGFGWNSSIAAPVIVEGRVWGVMIVATQGPEPFPVGAETRLAAFTDLVATAVANAQSHDEVRRFGDEQAALGRVATLVAGGAAAGDVFAAVVDEVSSLLGLERIELARYDGTARGTVIAASGDHPFPAGSSWSLNDPSVMATVARTRRPARIDDYSNLGGEIARMARSAGFQSAIGAPLTVEGRLWGVIIAISTDPEPIPEASEVRLAQFTELVATAVANADARDALERVAAEQAALRRIATLVARGVEAEAIFATVTAEIADMFGAIAAVMRFEHDPPAIVFLGVSDNAVPIGTRWELADGMTSAVVYRTGRSARLGTVDWASHTGPVAETAHRLDVQSQVSSPIVVEGSLWGVIGVNAKVELPRDTEQRLEKFAELVTTAIANAEGKSALNASRRRIVAASDETRRRIERDLHDGTQQRLVSLGLAVRAAEADLPLERDDLRAQLSGVAEGLVAAVEDLQEISRGIHPAILSKGGLAPALQALAHRFAIPVDLDIAADLRIEEPVEVAAYFVASEALANAAKHSEASRIDLSLDQRDGRLFLSVRDDGVGGADAARGSGLVGLSDRVEALGGSIRVSSRSGEGTQIDVALPV